MKWYNSKEASCGVVISSRVRLARNLSDTVFPQRADEAERTRVCERVRDALGKNGYERYNYISMKSLSSLDKSLLLEDHLISREFYLSDGEGRMLVTDENNTVSCMINEEDHLRIQAISPGLDIEGAYARASAVDDILSEGLSFAFDKELGYLTSCPTNLGTGLRASCMLHLPALTLAGGISSLVTLLTKLGLTVRGLYGEGSEADGCLYQISNQVTLGISEKDAIEKLSNAVSQIVEKEQRLRTDLMKRGGVDFEDSVYRSYGILKYARKISSGEFLKHWSTVRLGAECGVIKELEGVNLTRLLIETAPSHVMSRNKDIKSADERDERRAQIIKEYFV